MNWKDDPKEHARLWSSATQKIMNTLGKSDLKIANEIFSEQHDWMMKFAKDKNARDNLFNAWVMACFMIENEPAPLWFIDKHDGEMSAEEEEVVLAAHESWFGVFKVISHSQDSLVLIDESGNRFLAEFPALPQLKPGDSLVARLTSKGPGSWFAPGGIFQAADDSLYKQMASHRRFRDSWNSYLTGFFDYLQTKEGLSESVTDRHAENATLLTMFMEDRIELDSFVKLKPETLEKDFEKFANVGIRPKPNMKKVRESLSRFFTYLAEERGEKNPEVLDWLKTRV